MEEDEEKEEPEEPLLNPEDVLLTPPQLAPSRFAEEEMNRRTEEGG